MELNINNEDRSLIRMSLLTRKDRCRDMVGIYETEVAELDKLLDENIRLLNDHSQILTPEQKSILEEQVDNWVPVRDSRQNMVNHYKAEDRQLDEILGRL